MSRTKYHKQLKKKNNRESQSTLSTIDQNALLQSKVFEQAITSMGDTIEVMDLRRGQKVIKTEILENKRGLLDCKKTEEMNS